MKKLLFLILAFASAAFTHLDAQCTFGLTNTSSDTTYIISSNTALSCITSPGQRSYLICPGVKVTYLDNSCMQKFYLEPGATLIYDSISSYGYSYVYAKAGSTVDFNFRQTMKLFRESGTNVIDQPQIVMMPDSACSGSMIFDYSQLPNGTGCAAAGINDVVANDANIYPNPAADQLQLTLKSFSGEARYSIHDLMGRLVQEGKLTGEATLISTASLERGIYTITISGKDTHVLKFIKE